MANTMIFSSLPSKGQKFFKEDNQELAEVEDGKVYLNQQRLLENNLEAGDELTICTENGFRKTFIIAGSFKDAFLGSEMMGSEIHFHANADGKDVVVIVPTMDNNGTHIDSFHPGDKLNLTFSGNVCHMFDGNGENLEL